MFFVFFLGEYAGRQDPSRSEKVQEIIRLKAELKSRKSELYSKYTPPSFVFAFVVVVIVVILFLFGGLGRDDYRYHHRHSTVAHERAQRRG